LGEEYVAIFVWLAQHLTLFKGPQRGTPHWAATWTAKKTKSGGKIVLYYSKKIDPKNI
jgi:hypothetical protein